MQNLCGPGNRLAALQHHDRSARSIIPIGWLPISFVGKVLNRNWALPAVIGAERQPAGERRFTQASQRTCWD